MIDKVIKRQSALLILAMIIVIVVGLFDGWMTYYWDQKFRFLKLLTTFFFFTYITLVVVDFMLWRRKISNTKKIAITTVSILLGMITGFAYQSSKNHGSWDKEEAIIVTSIFILQIILSKLLITDDNVLKTESETDSLKKKIEIQKLKNELKKLSDDK